MLVTSIFSFSHGFFFFFFTLPRRKAVILAVFNLSSASAFNFVMSKILVFGKELTLPNTKIYQNSLPDDKILAWTKSKAFADDKPDFKILCQSKLKAFADDKIDNIMSQIK